MRIGTTPTHTFTFPFSTEECREIKITYSQEYKPVLEKYIQDMILDGNTVRVTLTQEDTFKFNQTKPVSIQAKVLKNGVVMTSDITTVAVYRCLDSEVLEVQT